VQYQTPIRNAILLEESINEIAWSKLGRLVPGIGECVRNWAMYLHTQTESLDREVARIRDADCPRFGLILGRLRLVRASKTLRRFVQPQAQVC
jgi:hypothetical protein